MSNYLYIPKYETETSHEYRSGSCICTRVAGVTFDGRQSVVAQLNIGEEIKLRYEPTNPHDHNAIRVECMNGQQIGYLNRHLAAILAPFFYKRNQLVPAWVHYLTGNMRLAYSLGVVIVFDIP
jgi:hypothetical protein